MPDSKQSRLSRILISSLAAVVSSLRGTRVPFIGARRSAALAKVDSRKWTLQLLKQLEWRRFEQLCRAYFDALGFRTSARRSGTGGAADIHLFAGGSDRTAIVVQSRAWDAYRVGLKATRELRRSMASANVGEGVLVTAGRFTQEAIKHAREENIQLIDGAELIAKMGALPPEKALALLELATQGDFLTPTCPDCSIKMISRKSTNEGRRFWGCRNYPSCKHTISSAAEAFS